jgi:release factor glutamine methyltransferase
LVELACTTIPSSAKEETLVWDVGTGSGAIALSLALHRPHICILATDSSQKALAIATKNARQLKLDQRVTFQQGNGLTPDIHTWLKRIQPEHLVIVGNLPYLPISDKKTLDVTVTNYEPHRALFSGKDGLTCIRIFLRELAASHLPFEKLFFEYDPPQTPLLHKAIKKYFPTMKTHIHPDLAGRDRVLELTKS